MAGFSRLNGPARSTDGHGADRWPRLPLWTRLTIAAQGRTSGRHRMPVPVLHGSVSTHWRQAQWDERDRQLAGEWALLEERSGRLTAQLAVQQARLASLTAEVDKAAAALQAVLADPADLTRRVFGEREAPPELVAARRQREWDARRRQAQTRLDQAGGTLRSCQDDLVGLQADLDGMRRRAALDGLSVDRTCRARLAIYDHALLARHPERALVSGCLDRTARDLPAWVADWLPTDSGVAR